MTELPYHAIAHFTKGGTIDTNAAESLARRA